jgi:hypothetical protein
MSEPNRKLEMAILGTDASNIAWALDYLRDGPRTRGLALLEISLDVKVLALSGLLQRLPPADHEVVIQALRFVRDYRRRHPRQIIDDESRLDKSKAGEVRKMAEEVQRILDETK